MRSIITKVVHRPKFEYVELDPILSYTLLTEKDRAF